MVVFRWYIVCLVFCKRQELFDLVKVDINSKSFCLSLPEDPSYHTKSVRNPLRRPSSHVLLDLRITVSPITQPLLITITFVLGTVTFLNLQEHLLLSYPEPLIYLHPLLLLPLTLLSTFQNRNPGPLTTWQHILILSDVLVKLLFSYPSRNQIWIPYVVL